MTGVILSEIGVVAGNDMTPECAFVKLSYLLAQPHLSLEEKKRWLATCMIGEMTSVVV
jgi:lysophospholipase